MNADKPRRLGRGLEALISGAVSTSRQGERTEASAPAGVDDVRRLQITQVRPNPFQPRREFVAAELEELAKSIGESGLIQPIVVRQAGDGFELIAGERRLRAAKKLGWTEIPAIVRPLADRAALTLALVENLQRADLNAVDEAEGYDRLIKEFGLTQQQVADAVGKDRSTIANTLRVLQLPEVVRRMLHEGQLTLGHARALLMLPNEREMVALARDVVGKGLSVRDAERRAREKAPSKARGAKPAAGTSTSKDPEARRIEDMLRRRLQTDVSLTVAAENRGDIRIAFYSADDLQRLLELLVGDPELA